MVAPDEVLNPNLREQLEQINDLAEALSVYRKSQDSASRYSAFRSIVQYVQDRF